MTEREMIIRMFERLGHDIDSEDENCIAACFGAHAYIELEFDENGNVIDIWG